MSDANEPIYKVIFVQQGKIYEIYSRQLTDESLMGFIEVEELLFGEQGASLLVDPNVEKLSNEFEGVRRCYIPLHTILRIDEVRQKGIAKIRTSADKTDNISPFPTLGVLRRDDR